jgi:hypothetical protein
MTKSSLKKRCHELADRAMENRLKKVAESPPQEARVKLLHKAVTGKPYPIPWADALRYGGTGALAGGLASVVADLFRGNSGVGRRALVSSLLGGLTGASIPLTGAFFKYRPYDMATPGRPEDIVDEEYLKRPLDGQAAELVLSPEEQARVFEDEVKPYYERYNNIVESNQRMKDFFSGLIKRFKGDN